MWFSSSSVLLLLCFTVQSLCLQQEGIAASTQAADAQCMSGDQRCSGYAILSSCKVGNITYCCPVTATYSYTIVLRYSGNNVISCACVNNGNQGFDCSGTTGNSAARVTSTAWLTCALTFFAVLFFVILRIK